MGNSYQKYHISRINGICAERLESPVVSRGCRLEHGSRYVTLKWTRVTHTLDVEAATLDGIPIGDGVVAQSGDDVSAVMSQISNMRSFKVHRKHCNSVAVIAIHGSAIRITDRHPAR